MRKKKIFYGGVALLMIFFVAESSVAAQLHATLSRVEKGWKLKSIVNQGGNVNLESGEWLGSTAAKSCARGFFGLTSGDCTEVDFVTGRPDGALIFGLPIVWPIGLVAGTIGTLFGNFRDENFFPIFIDRKFSDESYKVALADAIKREGGTERLARLQAEYARLLMAAKDVDLALSEGRGELQAFSLGMRQLAESTFRIKLVDDSGLWPGGSAPLESGDVQFELAPMELPPFASEENKELKPCQQAIERVAFPAASLDDFEKNLEKAVQALAQEKITYESQLAVLRSTLSQRTATVLLDDTERLTSRLGKNGYSSKTKLPERLLINRGTVTAGAEGTLTLVNRSFHQVLPQTYSYSNSDLDLLLQGETLKITNKTSSYISLDALTLYHQNDVLTLGGEKFKEIAPGAFFSFSLRNFDLDRLGTNYAGLTQEKARAQTIDFGFACKYRRNDLTQARSFVEIKPYRLLDLVMAKK